MNLAHTNSGTPAKVIRIAPSRGWVSLGLREFWQHRELLYFLVWRDIKVRYKQTLLGGAWAILQPLLTMVVFSLFFGRLAKVPSNGIPYPIFSFAALVPWTFFASGIAAAANSLVGNANLLRKVYFPRLCIPVASVLAGVVDFALALLLLIIMMPFYGVYPSLHILWLPLFLVLALASALGVGLWLAAINVQFRDVRYAVPFVTQIWMFASPVVYSASLVPSRWRALYGLNPMAGVVEGFRFSLLDASAISLEMVLLSTLVAVVLVVTGAFYFRRTEKTFADVV